MSPYAILGGVLLWGASIAGTAFWFYGAGKDSELATQAREDRAIQVTRDTAASAAGAAISKIEVKNVTLRQPLETIVRTEQVFHDCRSGPDAVRLLNATASGAASAASAAGDGKLP